ncbi:S9 family peptidase [Novosphingopyxis baekryungensis]|uniref:S9 family peptidase n=1 Tax=Novosphingopyxis baekryungensis TaxID=279369 RepID=UPI0003B5B448|nr:S9 family peptidase [Novosphingopyxis baekryungensis]
MKTHHIPPRAEPRPVTTEHHGIAVTDDYAWLRDAGYPKVENPEVLDYLNQENAWFEAHMAPQQPLTDTLFQEMRARIKEADESVPQKDGDWLYWVSFEEGAEYRKHWRKAADGSGEAQLIMDEPAMAEGLDYFSLGAASISPDGRLMAYAIDDNGSERYTARVRDLETGQDLPDEIPGTLSDLVWTADGTGFLYCLANDQWRTDNAKLHRLGDDPADDIELFHEEDEGFRVSVGETSSRRFLIISAGDHETSEVRLIDAADPTGPHILVRPRQTGVEYDVEEHDGLLYILTNDAHVNFRLVTAPLDDTSRWTALIEGSDDFYITGMEAYRDFYVIEGRRAGLDQIEIRYYDDPARIEPVDFPEEAFVAGLGDNPEYDQTVLRIGYNSMVTPGTVFDYDVAARSLETLKVQEIPSGYDASLYTTERLMITARDGVEVPVSILYRKDRAKPGPLHLYGYGAYGMAIPPGFSTTRLSLVDRGFAFAIAHIRGGDDLGRNWYLTGKREHRMNAFHDFIDCAKGLIDQGYTEQGRISISGGSAGGKLMGAVINMEPDLFGAVVAHVPFVDVLATMLDSSLPLTPGEFPEWGNPGTDKAAFELIRSYSPYDNVRAQAYPPMLVTAGLNDPRVTYWEPAKWVARLRATRTDDNVLLLKTNMGAGHGGKSGRWESLKETAEEYAFILWQMGHADAAA